MSDARPMFYSVSIIEALKSLTPTSFRGMDDWPWWTPVCLWVNHRPYRGELELAVGFHWPTRRASKWGEARFFGVWMDYGKEWIGPND